MAVETSDPIFLGQVINNAFSIINMKIKLVLTHEVYKHDIVNTVAEPTMKVKNSMSAP